MVGRGRRSTAYDLRSRLRAPRRSGCTTLARRRRCCSFGAPLHGPVGLGVTNEYRGHRRIAACSFGFRLRNYPSEVRGSASRMRRRSRRSSEATRHWRADGPNEINVYRIPLQPRAETDNASHATCLRDHATLTRSEVHENRAKHVNRAVARPQSLSATDVGPGGTRIPHPVIAPRPGQP